MDKPSFRVGNHSLTQYASGGLSHHAVVRKALVPITEHTTPLELESTIHDMNQVFLMGDSSPDSIQLRELAMANLNFAVKNLNIDESTRNTLAKFRDLISCSEVQSDESTNQDAFDLKEVVSHNLSDSVDDQGCCCNFFGRMC